MTPVKQLYIIRIVLGIIAAALSAVVAFLMGTAGGIDIFVDSLTVALMVYLVTYYILKAAYKNKIEKQSKILSTAIGMYFFTWITFLILFYTTLKVFM
jgi:zinc transporter ZupT